jgi:hypothetical protein
MEDLKFNPNEPLDYLPNSLKKVFVEQAQILYQELDDIFLKITTAPAPIKKHSDHKIRIVESRNPSWYSELYAQTNRGKRHLFKRSLERITQGKDKRVNPSNNWYNYDGLFRNLIYSRLINGYSEHNYFVEPDDNIRILFNLPPFDENYQKEEFNNKNNSIYTDEIPF